MRQVIASFILAFLCSVFTYLHKHKEVQARQKRIYQLERQLEQCEERYSQNIHAAYTHYQEGKCKLLK